jgi:hypothetical protein
MIFATLGMSRRFDRRDICAGSVALCVATISSWHFTGLF